MESLNEDTVKAAIRRALYDIKAGDAFVHGGFAEEDFERIQKLDEEAVDTFFRFVAKRLGETLSLTKKKKAVKGVLQTLQSQREMWLKEIQAYDGANEPSEDVTALDVDDASKDTPTKPKAEAGAESAVVTGDNESAGDKKRPADMDVEEPGTVKVESQKPQPKTDDSPSADANMDTEKPVKEDTEKSENHEDAASIDDSMSKPVADDSKLKPATEASDEQEPTDMDVEGPVKKETEKPQKSSKKRKAADDGKTPRKKPKGKKVDSRKKKKKSPKKLRKKAGPSAAQMEAAREKAKKEFEEEKTQILAELPEEYKNMWGQVGYSKWNKNWLPCLIVGPFEVPGNSDMRRQWMAMWEHTEKRRHMMTHLVYWYGQSDPSYSFSFQAKKQTIKYEEGVKKGYDKLPKLVQRKLDAEKKLSKSERELIEAHKQLAVDLLKQPQDRTKFDPITEVYEDDDYIRSLLNLEDSGDELISSDDDEELLSSASSSSELESDSEEDEKTASAKAKKTKKLAKKPAAKPMEEAELSFAEDEVSSDDDSKDEGVVLSDESSSDDEADEDYIVSGGKKKASSKSRTKKEEGPTEGKKRGKPSKEKKRGRPPKEKKEPSALALRRRAQKAFAQNEEEFLPILRKWKVAVKDENVGVINEVLQEMLRRVDSMGAPFMEAYNISPLMKATKNVLREKNVNRATHKELMSKLGELHAAKKALVPEGFVPKLRKTETKKPKKKNRKSEQRAPKPKREDIEAAEAPALGRNESASSMPGSQSSATPATPVRRVQSQGSSTPRPADSQSLASPKLKVPQATKAKSDKKPSFSLTRLLDKPTSSQPKAEVNSERQSSQSVTINKYLPSWMTSAPSDDVVRLPSEQVDRLLALEFFKATASHFPEEKVNRESIARALESAVYQWSLEQLRKEDTYWAKVHAVVAGICGKRKPGTLAAAIMAGEYESARDVVTLSDEILLHSFEGS